MRHGAAREKLLWWGWSGWGSHRGPRSSSACGSNWRLVGRERWASWAPPTSVTCRSRSSRPENQQIHLHSGPLEKDHHGHNPLGWNWIDRILQSGELAFDRIVYAWQVISPCLNYHFWAWMVSTISSRQIFSRIFVYTEVFIIFCFILTIDENLYNVSCTDTMISWASSALEKRLTSGFVEVDSSI
jgi:hypothetical protein